jgi:ABC-type uncharacterized transport system fused permease/ATPase subunit
VLDEATSALDPASQDQLMQLLDRELGATTIVSVAHRPELENSTIARSRSSAAAAGRAW